MIQVEGYKMFRGEMSITPKDKRFPEFIKAGDWLYRPDTGCWYCAGTSYPENICKIALDETE